MHTYVYIYTCIHTIRIAYSCLITHIVVVLCCECNQGLRCRRPSATVHTHTHTHVIHAHAFTHVPMHINSGFQTRDTCTWAVERVEGLDVDVVLTADTTQDVASMSAALQADEQASPLGPMPNFVHSTTARLQHSNTLIVSSKLHESFWTSWRSAR